MAKRSKQDYRRGNFLSRDIGKLPGKKPVVVRMIDRTILTASTRPNCFSRDEAHYMAAIGMLATDRTPLTKVVA